jgi:hypothetical protein
VEEYFISISTIYLYVITRLEALYRVIQFKTGLSVNRPSFILMAVHSGLVRNKVVALRRFLSE